MKKLELKQMESVVGGLTQTEWIGLICAGGGLISLGLLLTPAAAVGVASGTILTVACSFLGIAIIAQDNYYKDHPKESHGISAGTGDLPITTHHSQNGDESKGTSDGAGTKSERTEENRLSYN